MFEAVEVNASAPAIEADRVPAFTITHDDRDDETYTIPREISGPTSLRALEVYISSGEAATILWLAQHALGEAGMQALLDCEQMTLAQTKALLRRIGEQYVGQVKDLGKGQE